MKATTIRVNDVYQIYVRQNIEAGIKDSDNGRTIDVKEVRKKFGLTK